MFLNPNILQDFKTNTIQIMHETWNSTAFLCFMTLTFLWERMEYRSNSAHFKELSLFQDGGLEPIQKCPYPPPILFP